MKKVIKKSAKRWSKKSLLSHKKVNSNSERNVSKKLFKTLEKTDLRENEIWVHTCLLKNIFNVEKIKPKYGSKFDPKFH